jgi:hypothetical protein
VIVHARKGSKRLSWCGAASLFPDGVWVSSEESKSIPAAPDETNRWDETTCDACLDMHERDIRRKMKDYHGDDVFLRAHARAAELWDKYGHLRKPEAR